ncbi:hypothetical protein FACS18942_08610 [Planctomycetales bacterium]|nr:hypothetical protein FACS18942_08610 [Planctomycetales bacterium]
MEKIFAAENYLTEIIQTVKELDRSIDALKTRAEICGVPSPEHDIWFALLKQKLMPQLTENLFLIVAITGGTNTGKSLIFNHLAGEHFSGVDYRASGTKHPVCLVPAGQQNTSDGSNSAEIMLHRQFNTFKTVCWSNSEQALEENSSDFLFWAERENVPKNLIILDTPDIDSAAKVNWGRAKKICSAADVLIAVLTQEKYNDAAVRRFFREAVAAKKPVIVLFNMLELDEDVRHIPRWVEQFCTETKVQPLCILAVPYNKQQTENLTLPFYEISVSEEQNTAETTGQVRLDTLLSKLRFDEIKAQTLIGALDVLTSPEGGIPAYLTRVENTAKRFTNALETLEHIGETTVEWAFLPSSILANEIQLWWNESRPGWSKTVNSIYRNTGRTLLFPVKKIGTYVSEEFLGYKRESAGSFADFEEKEHGTAVILCEKMFQKLEKLAETDNPVLKRELLELLDGEHRAAMLEKAHTVLSSLEPVNEDFRSMLRKRLDDWKSGNPQTNLWLRRIDNVVSAVRPLITVMLALSGSAAVGAHIIGPMVSDVVITTIGGETLLAAGSEGMVGGITELFSQIQKDYVTLRYQRFSEAFQKEIWQDVLNRLQNGADITNSGEFQSCRKGISELSSARPLN